MNENGTGNGAEREEIEMLLPWYVTGNISDDDRARVDSYLADHPEIGRQLELAREEMDETVALNESLGTMPAGALDSLRSRLLGRHHEHVTHADKLLCSRSIEDHSAVGL